MNPDEPTSPVPVPERDPLPLMREPHLVVEEANRAAKALQNVISSKPTPIMINGEQYLEFEDWQLLGQFYGYSVKTEQAERVEIEAVSGAKAQAIVLDRQGRVVSGAEAFCLRDEEKWKDKPWHQLASMAQTRAGSKALKNRLAWVAVMAGYRPTPAEEMNGSVATAPPEPDLLTFGKHRGKRLAEVPTDYLIWLAGAEKEKHRNHPLQEAIANELARRASPQAAPAPKGDVNLFEYAKQEIAHAKTKGVAIATMAQYRIDPRLSLDEQTALTDAFNEKWAPTPEASV